MSTPASGNEKETCEWKNTNLINLSAALEPHGKCNGLSKVLPNKMSFAE